MSAESIKEQLCGKNGGLENLARRIAAIVSSEFSQVLEFEDLVSETALILLERKSQLCSRPKINLSYLVITVKHRLTDKFLRKKHLKTQSIYEGESEGERTIEDTLKVPAVHPIIYLNAKEALERLKEELSDKEFEILCYRAHSALYPKEENPFLRDKSRAAKDKAWSRLRPKVEKILEDFGFNIKDVGVFGELLMSECERKFR